MTALPSDRAYRRRDPSFMHAARRSECLRRQNPPPRTRGQIDGLARPFQCHHPRVLTPLLGKAQNSYIWGTAPEGPDSMADPIRRQDVADFVPKLHAILAETDSVTTPIP